MDRRIDPRFECTDNVSVGWNDKGTPHAQEAVLINISRSGARLLTHHRIPVGSKVSVDYPGGNFVGTVTHCLARKPNHVLGIAFAPGYEWLKNVFWPKNAPGLGRLPKTA